jgi:hypothetical protein
MSKIKDLKNAASNNVNVVEMFGLICPENKPAYMEMLLRILKNTPDLDNYIEDVKKNLAKKLDIAQSRLEVVNPWHLLFFDKFFDCMFNAPDIKIFKRFCEYNERGLIRQNNLHKYISFEEINTAVIEVDLIETQKSMEKQIRVIFENEEWLLLRPLTYDASKKYGSQTKWCTTYESDRSYFDKYAGKGVLIYVIKKQTNLKVGVYKSIEGDPEFSFWNAQDKKIDSIESGLSFEVLGLIQEEIKKWCYTNDSFLNNEFRVKENKTSKKSLTPLPEQLDVNW